MSEKAAVEGCIWLLSLYTELSSLLPLRGSCSTPKEERKLKAPTLAHSQLHRGVCLWDICGPAHTGQLLWVYWTEAKTTTVHFFVAECIPGPRAAVREILVTLY